MMSTQVYGKRVGKKPSKPQEWVEVKQSSDDPKWRSLAERIAFHRLYERNKHVGALKEAHPHRPYLWTVDFFFPYAKGGPLFIDEPALKPDIGESEMKTAFMLRAGFRFLIVKPKMTYEDCMTELLEIDARLKNGMANGAS